MRIKVLLHDHDVKSCKHLDETFRDKSAPRSLSLSLRVKSVGWHCGGQELKERRETGPGPFLLLWLGV